MPLISVIVPVYKVESYLRTCVDSILNQTFTDFELILVDDGSPDNCPIICDAYSKQDNRIIVIHKVNGGHSSARNCGLDYVFAKNNSEYITFIDSDDYIDENFLSKSLEVAKDNNSDLVILNFSYVKNGSAVPKDCLPCLNYTSKTFWETPFSSVSKIVPWGKLYKKNIFSNIRFPLGKNHEDEFVIHYIIDSCKIITTDNYYGYFYRLHNNMTSNNISSKMFYHKCLAYFDRGVFFQNKEWYLLAFRSFADSRECLIRSKTFLTNNAYKYFKGLIHLSMRQSYKYMSKRDINFREKLLIWMDLHCYKFKTKLLKTIKNNRI